MPFVCRVQVGTHDILRFGWLAECVSQGGIIHPKRKHLIYMTAATHQRLSELASRWG